MPYDILDAPAVTGITVMFNINGEQFSRLFNGDVRFHVDDNGHLRIVGAYGESIAFVAAGSWVYAEPVYA